MLTDPKKKIAIQTHCDCKNSKPYTHMNGKLYCEKCGYPIKGDE